MSKFKTALISVLILAAIFTGIYFATGFLGDKALTDESTWTTISEPKFSMTFPKCAKKGEMHLLSIGDKNTKNLCFYTSTYVGFHVNYHTYTSEEKEAVGGFSAKDYENFLAASKRSVNGQNVVYTAREGKNYVFAEYSRTASNHIGNTNNLWYIESIFPEEDGYYAVDIYCASGKKAEVRDLMLKWLDSFTIK